MTASGLLARFYYDLAGPRTDEALQALLGIAEPSRILYGSDWPFTPAAAVAHLLGLLSRTSVFDAAQLDAVMSENARHLLRRSRDGHEIPSPSEAWLLSPSDFKFETKHICLFPPPSKLDPTVAQQGLAVADRPPAVSGSCLVWHHMPSNQPTESAGARN